MPARSNHSREIGAWTRIRVREVAPNARLAAGLGCVNGGSSNLRLLPFRLLRQDTKVPDLSHCG